MKKCIAVMAAIAVLFSAAAFADDLSALTDEELLALRREVLDEMGRRWIPAEPETAAEPEGHTETAAEDTVLYYQPNGGEYYHLDPNCKRIHPKFLPLQDSFLYAAVNDEPYLDLKPCEVCGAPFRQGEQSAAMSFRDAVDAAGEYAAVGGDIDYLAVVAEKDGRYFRTVTILDSRARELYMAAMAAEDPGAAYEAFDAYAWSLPVCYTEEITAQPKGREELDAQAGKTVGELLEEGYSFYGIGGGENLPTVVDLSFGLFIYEFEVDASFEYYLEHEGWDGLESKKVKGGELSASLSLATNLDYLADGTYQPQVVPNITAEEMSAADSVPPIEEYSQKAWPLTAEGYFDLQNNMDARYGQVYMIEGVVHQVLFESPMQVIIYTGEDGKSQPVVVECPEQRSFSWEVGKSYRIYADLTSACYILPVLTARYTFSGLPEDEAGGEALPEEIVAADSSEGSRLIGLLVTREDLSGYTGEAGVVAASCTQKEPDDETEYTFGDISGLRLICFVAPDESGEGSRIISNADDGISAVDFDLSEDGSSVKMDAEINYVPGQDEGLFFFNPVLRTDSGQVFAVPGDFMAVSAAMNPPGSSSGQTVRDERKHTESGREITDTTTVNIRIEAVREPLAIRVLQFSGTHGLLRSEEFGPGTVPEQIVPLAEADYLLLETVEKDPDGGTFIRREAIGRDTDFLNTMSCRDDGICLSHYHEVLWETAVPEGNAVKDTVAGNIRTYREMTDGTWMCDDQVYQYRLEIKGRMPNADVDSSFVYLSNIGEISFEQAYMAAGLSSSLDDYFSPEEAVLVEMN